MQLRDKTILLTGATGGIGIQLARQLAAQGARLILVGRNSRVLAETTRELKSGSLQHCTLQLDLEKPEGLEELVSFCNGLPHGLDILINNAGIGDFNLLEHVSPATINRMINLNLTTPIILTTRLLPLLRQSPEGLVVNVGSVLGEIGNPGYSVYCASKAGLSRFSESLRREFADGEIRILHINPRATATEMNSDAVNAMNATLKIATDPPQSVASEIVTRILQDRFAPSSLGWPEKLYIRINALLPRLVDKAFAKNLPLIKRYAKAGFSTPVSGAENFIQSIPRRP